MSAPFDISELTQYQIAKMGDDNFARTARRLLQMSNEDRKENALLYYKPVSDHARKIHLSKAKTVGVGGGNGSSKTETCLVELLMWVTGIMPQSLSEELGSRGKFRGPINARVVCESLTNVLHQTILPKLQWWKWTGEGMPDTEKGHWGWVPRTSLIGGQWDRSWSEKLRTLRVICRDPDDPMKVMGESKIQFNSHDQDSSDLASGEFQFILHDEPPNYAIWRENEARTMRVDGRMFVAMTWPDDPSINVDWIFDEVYEPGRQGSNKDPNIDWFDLYTIHNPHLNQDAVSRQMDKWSDEVAKVRIYGQPIRFSNRIHALFTDLEQDWCFSCGKTVVRMEDGNCRCGSDSVVTFNHVEDFEPNRDWPTVFLIDPHPRKPHMMMWVQIDPSDDLQQVAELTVEGDCVDVREAVHELEQSMELSVRKRLIDPNMGRSPSSTKRGVTWQDEFDAAGLMCDLADDSSVGRSRFDDYLKPDGRTRKPRVRIRRLCIDTTAQIKRYVWDNWKHTMDRDQKQKPKDKYDDFPTLWKYLMNTDPTFSGLTLGGQVIHRRDLAGRGNFKQQQSRGNFKQQQQQRAREIW